MAVSIVAAFTYTCMHLYVSGVSTSTNYYTGFHTTEDKVMVELREPNPEAGTRGGILWFDERPVNSNGNVYGGQEARGVVCGLPADTSWEVRAAPILGSGTPAWSSWQSVGSTWPTTTATQAAGTVVNVGAVTGTYTISVGGTPTNYKIYDGGTVDAAGANYGVVITAPYVVLRNFTITNAAKHAVLLGVRDTENLPGDPDIHDIIITNNDISAWGSQDTNLTTLDANGNTIPNRYYLYGVNRNSAIYSYHSHLRRVTIQANNIHEPNFGANPWYLSAADAAVNPGLHPRGPQAITLNRNHSQDFDEGLYNLNSGNASSPDLRITGGSNLANVADRTAPGNHVIRYNQIWSVEGKYYNDIMGAFNSNGSNSGFLIRDTVIEFNYLDRSRDDVIEGDGAYRNVIIEGNYFNRFFQAISFQGRVGGPVIIQDNTFAESQYYGDTTEKGGAAFKTNSGSQGPSTGNLIDTLGGRAYIHRNTSASITAGAIDSFLRDGVTSQGKVSRVRNVRVYNNIINARNLHPVNMVQSDGSLLNKNHFDGNVYPKYNVSQHNSTGTRGAPYGLGASPVAQTMGTVTPMVYQTGPTLSGHPSVTTFLRFLASNVVSRQGLGVNTLGPVYGSNQGQYSGPYLGVYGASIYLP